MVEQKMTPYPKPEPYQVTSSLAPLLEKRGIRIFADLSLEPRPDQVSVIARTLIEEDDLGTLIIKFSDKDWTFVVPDTLDGSLLLSSLVSSLTSDEIIYLKAGPEDPLGTQKAIVLL